MIQFYHIYMVKIIKKHYKRRGESSTSSHRNKSVRKIQRVYRKSKSRRGLAFRKKYKFLAGIFIWKSRA